MPLDPITNDYITMPQNCDDFFIITMVLLRIPTAVQPMTGIEGFKGTPIRRGLGSTEMTSMEFNG